MPFRPVRRPVLRLAAILALLAADQATKALALRLGEQAAVSLLDGILRFATVLNDGTSLGLFAPGPGALAAVQVGVGVLALLTALPARRPAMALSAALIAAGSLGNGLDRMLHGAVVDFVDLGVPGGLRWPAFNLADAAICLGAAASLFVRFPAPRRSALP